MKRISLSHVAWLGFVLTAASAAACSSPDDPDVGGSGGQGSGGTASGGADNSSGGAPNSGGETNMSGGGPGTGGDGSGGDGPAAGGQGSGGGDGLTLVEPIMRSASSYVLEFGSYSFEVDPTQGARIVEFSLGGTNLLSPLEAGDFLNGGSTFWVAPQEPDWGWPPPEEMDSGAYTPALDGTTIVTESAASSINDNAISVIKSFSANLTEEAVDIVYEVENGGPAAAQHAPWEISRLARSGTTYWPKGSDTCGGNGITPTETDGVYFWKDAAQGSGLTNNKISCDGAEGWMAHLAGNLLFVKKWADVPTANQHSVDKEIQLYLGSDYIEAEMRGPFASIASGASTTWNVTWYVRPAPAETTDAALIAAARAIVQ